MSEEQIKYVVDQMKAGLDNYAIRQALSQAGYKDEQISTLLAEATKRTKGVPPPPPAPASSPDAPLSALSKSIQTVDPALDTAPVSASSQSTVPLSEQVFPSTPVVAPQAVDTSVAAD